MTDARKSLWNAVNNQRYFEGFTKSSQKISTHLLTVLTLRDIVQIEQRKRRKGTGNKKKRFPKIQNLLSPDKRNEK